LWPPKIDFWDYIAHNTLSKSSSPSFLPFLPNGFLSEPNNPLLSYLGLYSSSV